MLLLQYLLIMVLSLQVCCLATFRDFHLGMYFCVKYHMFYHEQLYKISHRINTACSGFITVMNGADIALAVESTIANAVSITFVNTFVGIRKI